MNIQQELAMIQQQELAPEVVKQAKENNDVEDLAEVCSIVEAELREASQERDLNKHDGIACLYMVVNRLADIEADPDE